MWRRKGMHTALAIALSVSMLGGTAVPAVPAFAAEPTVTGVEKTARAGSGTVLESSWTVANQNNNLIVNDDGSITINTERGEWGNMKNVLGQEITNAADFVLTVKVSGEVKNDFQGAYLMVSSDGKSANAVAAVRRYHSFLSGSHPQTMGMMSNGGSISEYYTPEENYSQDVYLRLKKSGSTFTSYYSYTYAGETDEGWTQITSGDKSSITQGNLAGTEKIYIGITANSGGSNASTPITFSDFRLNGKEIALGVDTDSLASVELTCDKVSVGDTVQTGLKGYDGNGEEIDLESADVEYSSDDESVARVDENGVVTGVAAGKTTIHCTATLGGVSKTASIEIQVGEITAEKTWNLQSPDGNTNLKAELMTGGSLQYTVLKDGKVTTETSPIGLVTNLGDFSKNLVYKSETEPVEINETYPMLSGKKTEYTNHCLEQTITFTLKNTPDVEFDFIIRSYDDGTAFRYGVRTEEEGKALSISKETTAFQLPEEADVYWMPHGSGQWTYEGYYEHNTTETLAEGAIPSIPLLYESKDGIWTLLTEAALNGTYTGSMTRVEKGGLLRLAFDPIQSKAVETTTPFVSPWRTAIVGTPEDIVNNTMVENLSPAMAEGYDFEDWVEPGVSSWSWVSFYGGQENKENHIKFIDLAADMGWEYYILDEGWQPKTTNGDGTRYTGYRDWFYEVRDYAASKGIKLIVWVDSKDISKKEDRESRLDQWAKDGIAGIKTDFFNHEAQSVLQVYDQLYKDCAERHMLVNIHGGNKPTGEIRTYPNVIAREGIAGQEQGGITAEQYTLIPFIRAAVGPADVTEQLFSRDTSKTTMGFQVALSVLVEDGIHSMGSKPEEYYSRSAAVSYYKNLPAAWEELKYVNGDPGSYVSLARRSGNQWYVSGISTAERTMEVPLDFLSAEEEYTAIIYKEKGRTDLEMEVQKVTSASILNVPVQKGGGYAIRVIPKDELSSIDTISVNTASVKLEQFHTQQIDVTTAPSDAQFKEVVWSSAEEEIASVDGNGLITGKKAGKTTVTVASAYDENVKAEIQVTVLPEKYTLDTDTWTVIQENANRVITGENSVTITTQNGGIGGNNLFAMKVPEGDSDFTITAKVTGGLNANYEGAFITVFDRDNIGGSYVSAGRRYHSFLFSDYPQRFGMMSGGGNIGEYYGRDNDYNQAAYIKLEKKGDVFTGYYSFDQENWTVIEQNENGKTASSVTNAKLAASDNLYVGFYASSGGSTSARKVTFEDFTYNGEPVKIANEREAIAGKVQFNVTPSDAVITVTKKDETEVIPPTEDGSYELMPGDYSYTVSKAGYEKKKGSFTVEEADETAIQVELSGIVGESDVEKMLQVAYEAYAGLDTDVYTEASASALKAAMDNAAIIVGGGEVEGKTTREVLTSLMQAAAGLTVDTSALENDIDAAKRAAEAAKEAADAAKQVADAAAKAEDMTTLNTAVSAAQSAADAAKKVADQALKDTQDNAAAIKILEAAVSTAQTAAETAQTAAETAQKTADKAAADAAVSKEEAEAAKATAEEAQKAAAQAKALAEAAQTRLEESLQQNVADKEALTKMEEEVKAAKAAAEAAEAAAKEAKNELSAAKLDLSRLEFKTSAVELKNVKSPKRKQMKVTWKKVEGAEGYEIRYAGNANFKKAKKVVIKKGTTLAKTVKKLKKGRKYFVKVRAYKTFDGTKVYTNYSEVRNVKIK